MILATAAVAAAVAVWIGFSLPPRPLVLSMPNDSGVVRGALHVHTNRSDGRGSPEAIASAARGAGLQFVIFTDHGDGTRTPDDPVYRDGVLCLDASEISTAGGHYLALDMRESPYPLGGEARDVVEDVRRLGGFGVAAHPDSPKSDLRWFEWTAPFDGIEIVNPDSSWRAIVEERGWRPKTRLLAALGAYPFRPGATIASLLGESPIAMARWESLTRRRRVVAVGGVDAHAKLGLRTATGDDPDDNRWTVAVPSYQAAFETLSVYVKPDRALSGDAATDAAQIIAAIRRGHAYTAVDGIASPAFLDAIVTNRRGAAQAGDELVADGQATLRVRTNAPAAFTTTIWRADQVFSADHHEQDFTVSIPADPAVYRIEIRASDRDQEPIWILGNPIYIRSAEPTPGLPVRPRATESVSLFTGKDATEWRIETDSISLAAMDVTEGLAGSELRLRFGLATGAPVHQFAALAVFPKKTQIAGYNRLTFTARAERPMRISVQLRAAASSGGDERWQRSVYVDTTDREATVFFDDVRPVGSTGSYRPDLANVHSIIFAIDTTNTRPGTSGRLWLRNVRLER